PVLVMLREHGELWGTLETIDRLLDAASPDLDALREACGRLGEQLDAHNQKEEAIIYRAAVEQLDPQTQESVAMALADETMPARWRCQLAPGRRGQGRERPRKAAKRSVGPAPSRGSTRWPKGIPEPRESSVRACSATDCAFATSAGSASAS